MSTTEIEIVPLTDEAQLAAIRELRFVWTNLDHTVAWGLTCDQTVAQRCPGGVTPANKSRIPLVVEYDVMMGHPQAVEIVSVIQAQRLKDGRSYSLGTLGAVA